MKSITLIFDIRVYRLSAVKKSAYRLGDRCTARIDLLPDGGIQVELTARSDAVSLDALAEEYLSELLDQDLRESIAEETQRVRNLILAQAFSGLSLTEAAADTADYRDDPMGIGRSQVS